jgi:hypothetical protein
MNRHLESLKNDSHIYEKLGCLRNNHLIDGFVSTSLMMTGLSIGLDIEYPGGRSLCFNTLFKDMQ